MRNNSDLYLDINYEEVKIPSASVDISNIYFKIESKERKESFWSIKAEQEKIKIEFINFYIPVAVPIDYDFSIYYPKTKDYLSGFVPEVYSIKLLNFEPAQIDNEKDEFTQQKIILLENPPEIKEIQVPEEPKFIVKTGMFNRFAIKNYLLPVKNIDELEIPLLTQFNPFEIKENEIFHPNFVFNEEKTEADLIDSPEIDNILQPEVEISNSEKTEIYKNLYQFQWSTADFLASNKNAYLFGEPGIGKTIASITALKYLFRKREIVNVLIVSNSALIGSALLSSNLNSPIGWFGHLQKYAPELNYSKLNEENKFSILKKLEPLHVYVSESNFIFSDFYESLLSGSKSYRFDCVIFDEIQLLAKHEKKLKPLLDKISHKYVWALSGIPDKNLRERLKNFSLPEYACKTIENSKPAQTGGIFHQEFWLEKETKQNLEYEQILFEGKNEIQQTLRTGNPFRLQSVILLSLHQLNQKYNFTSEDEVTPKAALLLNHLDMIISHKKKVIIFSQYDKQGVKKITRLLNNSGLKYLSCYPGIPPAEIRELEEKFINDDDLFVFVADSHVKDLQLKKLKVNYVIHFDQWWVPQIQWQLEDQLKYNVEQPLRIYKYFTTDSVEENIQRLLQAKGLLYKEVVETIGADKFTKLISEDEWLKIFELSAEEQNAVKENKEIDKYEKIKEYDQTQLLQIIQKFLMNLGYSNISVINSSNPAETILITGSYMSRNKNYEILSIINPSFNKISSEIIINSLDKLHAKEKYDKIFVLSVGEISLNNGGYGYMNVYKLSGAEFFTYLTLFNLV